MSSTSQNRNHVVLLGNLYAHSLIYLHPTLQVNLKSVPFAFMSPTSLRVGFYFKQSKIQAWFPVSPTQAPTITWLFLLEYKYNQVITYFVSFAASLLTTEWNMKSVIFSCIIFHVTIWNTLPMDCFSMAKTVALNPLKLESLLACFLWETSMHISNRSSLVDEVCGVQSATVHVLSALGLHAVLWF